MDPLILIVGKNLCVKPVEEAIARRQYQNYLCVDDIAMADWLMLDGCSCAIMIVDHALFPSSAEAQDWIANNTEAKSLLTNGEDLMSAGFFKRLVELLECHDLAREAASTEASEPKFAFPRCAVKTLPGTREGSQNWQQR
jgi:hypothetical protein